MIGKMKDRITLRNPTRTSNGRGGWKTDYSTGATQETWANIETLSVGQQLRYQEYQEQASVRIEIRDNPFLTEDTRIEHKGKTYEISQFGPHPKNARFLEIRALEV